MIRSQGPLRTRKRTQVHPLLLVIPVLRPVQRRHLAEQRDHVRMVRPERPLEHGERAAVIGLGDGVGALRAMQLSELVRDGRDVGMLRAHRLLKNRQRALVELPGRCESVLRAMPVREDRQHHGSLGVFALRSFRLGERRFGFRATRGIRGDRVRRAALLRAQPGSRLGSGCNRCAREKNTADYIDTQHETPSLNAKLPPLIHQHRTLPWCARVCRGLTRLLSGLLLRCYFVVFGRRKPLLINTLQMLFTVPLHRCQVWTATCQLMHCKTLRARNTRYDAVSPR